MLQQNEASFSLIVLMHTMGAHSSLKRVFKCWYGAASFYRSVLMPSMGDHTSLRVFSNVGTGRLASTELC